VGAARGEKASGDIRNHSADRRNNPGLLIFACWEHLSK
jgi:hypothetical protein